MISRGLFSKKIGHVKKHVKPTEVYDSCFEPVFRICVIAMGQRIYLYDNFC